MALYRTAVVIDAHNDLSTRILDHGYDPDVLHEPGFQKHQGETDLPRLIASGITAQFFAAFVDARFAARVPDESFARAMAHLDVLHAFVGRHPQSLVAATTAAEVRHAKQQGRVAILLGVEGGHAIQDSLENLRLLYHRGVRYLTLTWNNGNNWAGSSIGVNGTRTGGLTEFGHRVIAEMNSLGMLVDVSHVSDETLDDVLAATTAPVVASHSCARAIAPAPRNLDDHHLGAIARGGGVINVNFYSAFLDPRFFEEKARIDGSVAEDRIDELARQLQPPPLSTLIDHFHHIVTVAGIDHVGIGSDFDGVGGLLPTGMRDVTSLPLIAEELLARGYADDAVRKILGENMLRVMEQVLDD